jgi:hypothetical protein
MRPTTCETGAGGYDDDVAACGFVKEFGYSWETALNLHVIDALEKMTAAA